MAVNETWNIRARATVCHATDHSFEDGESVYAAIYKNEGEDGYERRDYCAAAWQSLKSGEGKVEGEGENATPPYSSWRTTFEPSEAASKKNDVVEKESAEALLRRLIEEDDANSENARYILALMLERKKILKQVDVKDGDEMRMLFYEHIKNGDAIIVRDPLLKLSEIDAIQEEVAGWLGADKPGDKEGENASQVAEPSETEPAAEVEVEVEEKA
jgi:hypothetical protein